MAVNHVGTFLDAPARDDPERPALIMEDGDVWPYRRLRDEQARWAATLATAGVRAGDRVALADWGGPRSTAVTLAAAALGAATVQLNPLLTADELRAILEVAPCAPVAVAGRDGRDALGRVVDLVLDEPEGSGAQPPLAGGGNGAALILLTSGTTGTPKPVPITHDALAARVAAYRPPFSPGRAPGRSLMCVPSFHVGGMLGLLLSLYGGDTTVIQPRFDAGRWLQLVADHRVASVFLVPTMLARILDHPACASADVSSLAVVSYGAAAAPVDLVRRAMAAWPHAGFANTFGQTETLGAYTTLAPADHHDPALVGSVGRPLPGVELRVVDPATGDDVAAGTIGELWVRSAQNVREGWLATGDLARIDERGYVFPAGRLADTINRGGEKFSPAEIAGVLRRHPAVSDVAVAGVPDAEMGERVGAAVVLCPGHEGITLGELRSWCDGALAPFKWPEVVAVVDALPYNELGKLSRRATAELIASHRS